MTLDRAPAEASARRSGRAQDDRWRLRDERDFLRRSLEDADRERDAGDLSDEDHALLVTRDSARLAAVEDELAALGPEPAAPARPQPAGTPVETQDAPAPIPWPLWSKVGIVVACLLIVAGGALLVTHFVQARQPGQASSGSVSLSQAQMIEQQLQQALTLNNKGNTEAALELYNKVLTEDPSNPAALAYAGYLQWNIGSASHVASLVRIGRAEIETALKDWPSYSESHLFDGLIRLNQDHNDKAAVAQFNDFLADDPPTGEAPKVAPLVAGAYKGAGMALPSAFAGTTTPSTS